MRGLQGLWRLRHDTGYSGTPIFFTFMPIGIIAGALIGAVGFGLVAARDAANTPPGNAP